MQNREYRMRPSRWASASLGTLMGAWFAESLFPCVRLVRLRATCLATVVCLGAAAPAAPQTPQPAADINRDFLDPDLDPEAWLGRFEVESREVFAARRSLLTAVGLKPGDRVVDIGSGTGLFVAPFSKATGPTGRVYAVDISPKLVAFVEQRVKKEQLPNVAVALSTPTSIGLPPGSINQAFACDVYHHFEHHEAMLATIFTAMTPGGSFVVVDFERIPGVSREWLLGHVRADKATVRHEIERAGFDFLEEVTIPEFRENYCLRFRKPGKAAP